MSEIFFSRFNEKVPLTQTEEQAIARHLVPKKLRKQQYLLQEGDICGQIALVEQGALRCYAVDQQGQEHITAFAMEGWTIGDLCSFLRNEPSVLNIDALEDSEVLLISKESHDKLLNEVPKYETYIRILVTDAYVALQKRTLNMLSMTIEQRYLTFLEVYPDIVQRVPQHMLASFMGLSAETLSRLRSRLHTTK
jgi:CRP-like cAMP-binding protein